MEQGFAVFLAVLNAFSRAAAARTYSLHLSLVLLAVFGVYAYRDVWPLATFTLRPADAPEGLILWFKVVIASLVAVIEPVLEPYPYIPVDPNVSSHLRSSFYVTLKTMIGSFPGGKSRTNRTFAELYLVHLPRWDHMGSIQNPASAS